MSATRGPLRVCSRNPRYLEDDGGKVVWLTGSHTWTNLATDQGTAPFDFDAYLAWLGRLGHTFVRGWIWDLPYSRQGMNGGPFSFAPQPFARTGPGLAADGRPRFDLEQPDPFFYRRLRERVAAAGRVGIYVSVMLFQGYAWQFDRTEGDGLPYDRRNNVNGVDAGPQDAALTLADPDVLAAQERHLGWVVDAVGDLDNVLFEIANEAGSASIAWQHHLIAALRRLQQARGRRRPIGMTHAFEGGTVANLRTSGADWISPDSDLATRTDPPVADGRQVVVYDTDHGYDWRSLRAQTPREHRAWVWRCLMRGAGGVLFMDPYLSRIEIEGVVRNMPGRVDGADVPDPFWDGLRQAMGHARAFADAVPLARMVPRPDLADTGWCLAEPGAVFAVYVPEPGMVRVAAPPGRYGIRWFAPETGVFSAPVETRAEPGGIQLRSPSSTDAAVLVERL